MTTNEALSHFNSIKVRLKLYNFFNHSALDINFNSIKVRLKRFSDGDGITVCYISIP